MQTAVKSRKVSLFAVLVLLAALALSIAIRAQTAGNTHAPGGGSGQEYLVP